MRRRRSQTQIGDQTKLRDLERLDERVAEIDDLNVDMLRQPRAFRQATKLDATKPRKGRSR